MPSTTCFISYRRDDTAGYARSVCDALSRALGAERVFMDVDDIAAGQPFSQVIRHAVGSATVLLVLIGPRWLGERDGQPPRIMEPGDFVRLEVATALGKHMRVIPLLFDGATMPSPGQLPPDLQSLAERNALEIDNTRFAADMARLVQAVRGSPDSPASQSGGLARWAIGGLLAALVGAAGLWWARTPSTPVTALPAATPVPAARPARAAINGDWVAAVRYSWPNSNFVERFTFSGTASAVEGRASFLSVPRNVLEGRTEGEELRFVTRTRDADDHEHVHRYSARLVDGTLQMRMETESKGALEPAVEFVARRDTSTVRPLQR